MSESGLPIPILMLVTDRHSVGGEDNLVRIVSQAVAGGANAVQVREKDLGRHALIELGVRLKEAIAGRALLFANGSRGVAVDMGADALHLPENVALAGSGDLIIGRSVHSAETARRAAAEGVDYLVAGPIFETASHPGAEASGVKLISDIVAAVGVPVIAIGGITADNTPLVMAAGAGGVAVIASILRAPDAKVAAARLREAIDAAAPVGK